MTTKLSKCMFRLRQWQSSTASASTVMTSKEEEQPQAFRAGMNSQRRILEMNWPSEKNPYDEINYVRFTPISSIGSIGGEEYFK